MDENVEKLAKARLKTADMTLRSPIDGTVSGSTVTSVGQVLTVGEQVMQIVPSDTKLEIECYLPNADIGFVRMNQDAVVKIDSFPFTDYGTIDGRVTRVAHDAIPQPDADQREQNPAAAARDGGLFGGAQRFQNLVFPVTLTMDRDVDDDRGIASRAPPPRHGRDGGDQDRHAPHPVLPVLAHPPGGHHGLQGAVNRDRRASGSSRSAGRLVP